MAGRSEGTAGTEGNFWCAAKLAGAAARDLPYFQQKNFSPTKGIRTMSANISPRLVA